MTDQKAKAEAEKIRQSFYDIVSDDARAKTCSILQVKGILNLHTLEIGKGMMLSGCRNDSLYWKSILTCLEDL